MFKQSVKQIIVLLPIYCWVQQCQLSIIILTHSLQSLLSFNGKIPPTKRTITIC